MKTKLGLNKSTVKSFIFFIAAVGGFTPLLITAGYVYLVEKNDDLQDCVVTALKICIVCSVLQLLINYIPSIFNWVSTFAKLASINVKTSNLDNVCRAIGQIIVFIGNIKLILFGLKQGN